MQAVVSDAADDSFYDYHVLSVSHVVIACLF